MTMKNNYLVDYYFTKRSDKVGDYDTYDTINKYKMTATPSSDNFGNKMDVFIPKKDFPQNMKPSSHDMVFFTEDKKFYETCGFEDAGDFYIIEVTIYKSKEDK